MNENLKTIPEITRSWIHQREILTAKYAILTEADFNFEQGQKEDLFDHIQAKLGKTRRELIAILSSI